jgi:single-stranded DNA-binding protein
VNSVQLVGRLATDVDVKEVTGGSKVCSFILAVDRNAEEAEFALLPTDRGQFSQRGTRQR